MSALISIVQNAGHTYAGAEQEIAKNTSNLITIDNASASKLSYPMGIPTVGKNYSFEVWIRCRCDLAPNVKCDNFKAWYDSGMPVSGYNLTVNSDAVSSYVAPIAVESSQGTRIDFTTKTATGNSIALSGDLVNIGDYTSWLVFQLEVLTTADTGNFEVDYIIEYDEV